MVLNLKILFCIKLGYILINEISSPNPKWGPGAKPRLAMGEIPLGMSS